MTEGRARALIHCAFVGSRWTQHANVELQHSSQWQRTYYNVLLYAASNRVTHWNISPSNPKQGSIRYTNGSIVVARKGYYYVYSQMSYYDGTALLMGHYTYINTKRVMISLASVISQFRKYNTKYHGGVFLLYVGDTISVRLPYTKFYNMAKEGSFLGTFLINPVP